MPTEPQHLRSTLAKDFPSKPDAVLKATRDFLAGSFPQWRVESVADGLDATGVSGSHPATARFRVRKIPGGTSLSVEYLTQQPELSRSCTVDDGPLDNWLQDIRLRLHPRLNTDFERSSSGRLFLAIKTVVVNGIAGLMIVMVVIWFMVLFAVLPAIGLLTGDLYIPGKYRPGLDIHGPWARIISAGMLVVFAFGLRSFLRGARRYLRQFRARYGRRGMLLVWLAVGVVACLLGLMVLGMIVGDNP